MKRFIHARVYPGKDSDLIEWLEAQPEGGRSEAIRALMRDGLRMRQLEKSLASVVRQAIADSLAGRQITQTEQKDTGTDSNDAEMMFGDQLDEMMSRFD